MSSTATTSGQVLVLDSWALLEIAVNGPRREEVEARQRAAHRLVTARDAIFESYNFILRRSRPTLAREWWQVIRESNLKIVEPSLDEVDDIFRQVDRSCGLSAVDAAVACVARKMRVTEVATNDKEFQALGLTPLFA